MSVPKVFISSTYYDLKQYRINIENFIKSLGYEPVMHERAAIAYSQNQPLEKDCYTELTFCEIVVCIIGNHFGSQSSESDLSVTMEELKTALKEKKKIYVFISKDVFYENKTYKLNKDNENFKSAYTDNIKIHEYIAELTENVNDHYIAPFETTDEIISILRAQFAGLFQGLLSREAAMTEASTVYDLQQTADSIRKIVQEFAEEKASFYEKINCTYIRNNLILTKIKQIIGLSRCAFFAQDISALDEFMRFAGFTKEEINDEDCAAKYCKTEHDGNEIMIKTIYLGKKLLDRNLNLRTDCTRADVEDGLKYEETTEYIDVETDFQTVNDDDLPF